MNQGELDKIREIGGNDFDLGLKFKGNCLGADKIEYEQSVGRV